MINEKLEISLNILTAFLALPFKLILSPFWIIIKTIVTIWQPYFYKKGIERWDKKSQKYRRKGILIDYPPRYGTLLGIGPWQQTWRLICRFMEEDIDD